MERTEREFGALHALVNNAAIARDGDVEEETLEGWNQVLAVNLTGLARDEGGAPAPPPRGRARS